MFANKNEYLIAFSSKCNALLWRSNLIKLRFQRRLKLENVYGVRNVNQTHWQGVQQAPAILVKMR